LIKVVQNKLAEDIANALKPMLAEIATTTTQAEELQGRSCAHEQWRTFENQVLNEGFRGTEKGRPYFAVAIIPLKKPSKPLDVGGFEDTISSRGKPIGVNGWNTDRCGRSIVTNNSARTRGSRPYEPPTAATELTDTGCVFAVADLHPGQWTSDGQYRTIPPQHDERLWIMAVDRYVLLLRDLKVSGRFIVRMMLTDCHNMIMLPQGYRMYDPEDFRGLPTEDFHFEPAVVEPDGVIAALRPSFEVLWREAGVRRDPSFTDAGDWR
jgi:hypothetical protein